MEIPCVEILKKIDISTQGIDRVWTKICWRNFLNLFFLRGMRELGKMLPINVITLLPLAKNDVFDFFEKMMPPREGSILKKFLRRPI